MFKIFLIELIIHLVIFFTILEVYFKEPILNIEESQNVTRLGKVPLGKRVVLIVIDNLPAISIYNASVDTYFEGADFTKNVIQTNGTWGIAKATPQIDNLSGYRSIFFGIKEHPSHIKNYWRYFSNDVQHDSIVNYTELTYCFGNTHSPFNILSASKAYRILTKIPKNTKCIDRDTFVVEKLMNEMNNGFQNKSEYFKQKLHSNKILFFISLDGSNCVTQNYGPFSNVSNLYLKSLDKILMNIERFFINFYKDDNQTTFILTSNRGFNHIETHSNTSDEEIQLPFLVWGAGIKKLKTQRPLNQIDIPALIASLLNIPIPKESMGKVPIRYLNISSQQLAAISFSNAKQLLSLFHEYEEQKSRYVGYKAYEPLLKESYLLKNIENLNNNGSYDISILKSQQLINETYSGFSYVENYYKPLVCLMLLLILLFWNLLLLEFIVNTNREQSSHRLFAFCDLTPIYTKSKLESDYLEVYRFITIVVVLLMINVSFGIATKTPPRYMVMFALVQLLFVAVILKSLVWFRYVSKYFKKAFVDQYICLKNAMIYLICIQFLMASLQHRNMFTITTLGYCLWLISVSYTIPFNITYFHWILSSLLLAIFPNLPPVSNHMDSFYHQLLPLGLILWIIITYIHFPFFVMTNRWTISNVERVNGTVNLSERKDYGIGRLQMIIIAIVASIKLLFYYQKPNCFPLHPLPYFGWGCTGVCFILTFLTSLNIDYRVISIYYTLLIPVLISSIAYENIFFLALIYNLFSWIRMEKLKIETKASQAETKNTFQVEKDENTITHLYRKTENSVYFNDFRRVLFMIYYIMIAFFGTNNYKELFEWSEKMVDGFISINSTRDNPIIPYLIMYKILIPILSVFITIYTILLIKNQISLHKFYLILMFTANIFTVHLIYMIKTDGNWYDIMTSFTVFTLFNFLFLLVPIMFKFAIFFTSVQLRAKGTS